MDTTKERIYEKLVDAVSASPYFSQIPLPACLDNKLEELNKRYGYNEENVPKEARPSFDPPTADEDEVPSIKPPTREELSKKLREKMKHLEKRRQAVPPKKK